MMPTRAWPDSSLKRRSSNAVMNAPWRSTPSNNSPGVPILRLLLVQRADRRGLAPQKSLPLISAKKASERRVFVPGLAGDHTGDEAPPDRNGTDHDRRAEQPVDGAGADEREARAHEILAET